MSGSKRMIRAHKLDVVGTMFGLTFEPDEQVTLWMEDDEIWYSVVTFHADWIGDLHRVLWGGLQEWAKRKVSGRKS